MIDLHVHILPGLDDGPASVAQSIQLGRAAAADGVQVVAATPHLREDHPRVRPQELADRCARLNDVLAGEEIALEVVPGGELDVLWVLDATPEELRLVSFGQAGTDVLLETPYGAIAPSFEAAIDRLDSLGYRVLLAHPERSRQFQQAPGRLAALVRRGVLIQVTAGSVASEDARSRSRELAWRLIENGFAHVIASDAHSASTFRPPDLSAAVARLGAFKPALARWMVTDVPLAILAGNELPPMPGQLRPPGGGGARGG